MFKKKPTIKALAPLRSSDRRKLADQLIKDYEIGLAILSDGQSPEQAAEATAARTALRNSLLPDNTKSARFTTTHGPELKQASGNIYVGSQDDEEARILWFQIEGRMYPSVYTLWKNPSIVPLIHTHGIVVQKLQGGADLMTPGLTRGPPFPPKARKGAVVAIASTESPSVPVAIGECEIDVSALQSVQGMKGHAVKNLHWLGDEIWSYSTNGRPGQSAPDQIEGWSKTLTGTEVSQQFAELDLDDDDPVGGVSLGDGGPDPDSIVVSDEVSHGHANGVGEGVANDEPAQELAQKDIDAAFRSAFLYGLHQQKTTNESKPSFGLDLPLTQTVVMSTLIQPFLPAFTPAQSQQYQIKKTSWKTMKKFIKYLDKSQIVKSKDRGKDEAVILDIDFNDAAITNFKPYPLPKKETTSTGAESHGESTKEMSADDAIRQKLEVISYLRPTSRLEPLFAARPESQYTPAEVRTVITAYIEAENLAVETNRRLVKLNPDLANVVFDGSLSLDAEVVAKGSVPREALIDRIQKAMTNHHVIARVGGDPASVKVKSGPAPKILITMETRSGNKVATKVSGLERYFVNARPLADELRVKCASSVSVEPLVGGAKKSEKEVLEVMIQGPQSDAVLTALKKRGVDRKWVEIVDKTKGKKK